MSSDPSIPQIETRSPPEHAPTSSTTITTTTMLAFVPSSPSDYTYAPPISSPLAPLSTNIYGTRPRHTNYMNPHEPDAKNNNSSSTKKDSRYSENNTAPSSPSFLSSIPRSEASKPQPTNFSASITTPPTTTPKLPFSQRSIKRNPLQQASSSSTLQTARRNNYLRKISSQRDDKRFESRGEDLMRLDFLSRQRAWEADRAREAEKAAWDEGILEEEEEAYEDEEYDLPVTSQMGAPVWANSGIGEEDEVEEFVRDEGRELEALLEIMPRDDDAMEEDGGGDETSLWSDDADYDELFEEMLLSQQNQGGMGQNVIGSAMLSSQAMPDMQQQQHDGGEDEMDMS